MIDREEMARRLRRQTADQIEADGKLLADMQAVIFKAAYFSGYAEVEREALAILARMEKNDEQ